ncbi:hypothetical protein B0H15DRAFT_939305 [Mycena belliarum]|uniref:Transposase family Tnp2 protein n=1 Tax=Mycena belliarum TaxID=1033014 RepID=A0AAD6U3G6_9AGAR|nr:hypothetical protein B0H15DRAFT_939305 [Mycena belliae]
MAPSPPTPTARLTAHKLCTCSHTCGMHGKWIPARTRTFHRTKEKKLGSLGTRRSSSPAADHSRADGPVPTQRGRPSNTDWDAPEQEQSPPPEFEEDDSPEGSHPRRNSELITNRFIQCLQEATLSNPDELDADVIDRLENPPSHTPVLDADQRLAVDLFLSVTDASEKVYNTMRAAIMRRHPDDPILSYHGVKRLVVEISGVTSIIKDMCINTCLAYTGPFAEEDSCRYCHEPRYDPKRPGARVPRRQFHTIPLGPQLQAIHRSRESAEQLNYRKQYTDRVLAELDANDGVHVSAYKDLFDGSDYLEAVLDGKIKNGDMILMFSIDGAQLYRNKVSDTWMYIWLLFDRTPGIRYKKRYVLPGSYSFREGLNIWDCLTDTVKTSDPFLALATADGPGMASVNGCVGHHGKHLCRVYCPMKGRHKSGAPTYYPARLLPANYRVKGCDHPDVELRPLLEGFNSDEAAQRYQTNLIFLSEAKNEAQYNNRRLETGISKPTIFSGLHPDHILGIPDIFGIDTMHLPCLNLPDLLIPLWRGLFECDKSDDKSTWEWIVLIADTWRQHGKAVAELSKYIPGSFDNPPRNPAEKINSGYKAWEFLLYFFGMGPALFYGILPEQFYVHYCKVVRGIRILLQEEILPEELVESNELLIEFSDTFEELYVQRRADRMHFIRPVMHTISHMPGSTVRKGPGNLYSQWVMERTIGNLGEEIRQHSDPYSNLAQRCIRRTQVNALKAIIPDLEPDTNPLPHGSIDLGDGFVLLRAMDNCSRDVSDSEAEAIRIYIRANDFDSDSDSDTGTSPSQDYADRWRSSVIRWARVRLPNGQVARCSWKEGKKKECRRARVVKQPEFAEVHFYMILEIHHVKHYIAVASFFGPPDPYLLQLSSSTYWSVQHQRDSDVRAFKIKQIRSCVMMGPDAQWFLMEKPGLKLAEMVEDEENMEGE